MLGLIFHLVVGYFEFDAISNAYAFYFANECVRGLKRYNMAYMQLIHARKVIQITKSKMSHLEAGIGSYTNLITYASTPPVSGHSKPASKGRMKTSHFEGSIACWAAWAAHGRNERTQCELAAYDINFGGQRLVQPADCA